MLDLREARAGSQQRELQPKEGGDDRLPTWMVRAFFAEVAVTLLGTGLEGESWVCPSVFRERMDQP